MRYKYTVLLLIIVLVAGSCKKDEDKDYRHKFTGPWNFYVTRSELNTDSVGYSYKDTIYYNGGIVNGESGNEIQIKYTSEDSITLTVGVNGKLTDFPTVYCSGEFVFMDSLHLYLRWGGLGGGIIHQVEGSRN